MKVFISYRRDGGLAVAGRLCDRLRSHFGTNSVFMDLDGIPVGKDFRTSIKDAIENSDAFVVLIGPGWAGPTLQGRRLKDPKDFVRIEMESAFRGKVPVIPVLLASATMPSEADLPPSLVQLSYLNALYLDAGRDFKVHATQLINSLQSLPNRRKQSIPFSKSMGSKSSWLLGIGACLALLLISCLAWFVLKQSGRGLLPVATEVPTSKPSVTAAESPVRTNNPPLATEASSSLSEREKLMQEQLELHRAKADLEKKKFEQDLAFERQKAELERERRKKEDEDREKSLKAIEAAVFSDADFAAMRDLIIENRDTFGQLLIEHTHPTGKYSSTDKPVVNLSSPKDSVTATVTVHWKGGFSEDPYITTFSFRLAKRGLDRLEVIRDNALFKIDPQFLKTAELDLRRKFDPCGS